MVSRCIRGHYQPLLLLYADPRGTPVVLQDSPSGSNPQLEIQQNCSKAGYDSEDSGTLLVKRYSSSSRVLKRRLLELMLYSSCTRMKCRTRRLATRIYIGRAFIQGTHRH